MPIFLHQGYEISRGFRDIMYEPLLLYSIHIKHSDKSLHSRLMPPGLVADTQSSLISVHKPLLSDYIKHSYYIQRARSIQLMSV